MSPQVEKILAALCEAQASMKRAVKDSTNPFHKSKYADLESVWDACKDALTAANLALLQNFETIEGRSHIVTMLAHSSGQWIKSYLMLPFPFETVDKSGQLLTKNDPQTLGSVITYCRRYSLAAMLGIVQTDDDAQHAIASPNYPQKAQIKAPIPAKEIRAPEPKVETQQAPFDSPVEALKEFISVNGGNPDRVSDFISERAGYAKQPPEKVIGAALSSKQMTKKFFDSYSTWLENQLAAVNA